MTVVAAWFDERVRPLLRYAPGDDAAWVPLADVASETALAGIEARQLAGAGAPPRVSLTTAAGWMSGYAAAALATGLLRDGVLLRLSAATGGEGRREAGGWLSDLRFRDAPILVPPGHPLAGAPGAQVVADPAAAFGDEVAAACGPWIDAIAVRSGRSRSGLWAMVADSVGGVARTLAATHDDRAYAIPLATTPSGRAPSREDGTDGDRGPRTLADWSAAANGLLERPGPWKRGPQLRVAHHPGGPVLVQHRVSCCLWYRCDPDLADDPAAVRAAIEEEPNYCSTCVFRTPEDVEARALADATRATA